MHSLFLCAIEEISISFDVIHLKKKVEHYMKHFLKHRYRQVQSVDIPCKLPQAVDNITNTGRQTTINDKREDMLHKSILQ